MRSNINLKAADNIVSNHRIQHRQLSQDIRSSKLIFRFRNRLYDGFFLSVDMGEIY